MIRDVARKDRKHLRLQGWDYSTRRWYFVTICTFRRRPLFGVLGPDGVALSVIGEIVEDEWQRTEVVRDDVYLDEFVVMPDHFHALIGLHPTHRPHEESSLDQIIGQFKGVVTRRARALSPDQFDAIWQRSFYDSIVRDDRHFRRVQSYVKANPADAWQAAKGR